LSRMKKEPVRQALLRWFLQHRRAAGDDPGCKRRDEQRTGIDAAGAAIEVGAQHAEHDDLRHKEDQQRHERSAEGGAEEHVRAGPDAEEERNVFDQHDQQDPADHQKRIAPPVGHKTLEALFVCRFRAHGRHDLRIVEKEEQRKHRDVDKELSEARQRKGLEERPDEPEIKLEAYACEEHDKIQEGKQEEDEDAGTEQQSPRDPVRIIF